MTLTLGGCGLFQGSQESPEEPPLAESPPPSQETPEEDPFEETPTPSTIQPPAAEGLIASTTPNERKKNIEQGRNNPFSAISIQPIIRPKAADNGVSEPEKLCRIDEVNTAPTTIAQAPGTNTPASDATLPPLLAPVLPIPNEARGVVVSGVMQLDGTPVAIVKAPNENVARQVTVGASLSNGQVQVKAINVGGQKPYVVLEQYGLDIPRGVGEPAEEAVAPPTPAAPTADGTPQPVAADPGTPSLPAPGPNGFGTIRNLTLLTLNIGEVILGEDRGDDSRSLVRVSGTICNEGLESITVEALSMQVEDKTTGSVLDTFAIGLGRPGYTLGSGQKAEFDGSIPKLRGRKRGDVNIKLVEWR
ncbi:hypothetical protein [Crocosphaera sp. Alani8]|uniref:hypothetical protein n=1 Tax=Crocosphaera sp. Alani8 TaxID=3038952 RepID=UPI00313B746C